MQAVWNGQKIVRRVGFSEISKFSVSFNKFVNVIFGNLFLEDCFLEDTSLANKPKFFLKCSCFISKKTL